LGRWRNRARDPGKQKFFAPLFFKKAAFAYDNSGDQLGSEASVGVWVMRSLKPSMPMVTRCES
jgi:hypothetical protein